MTTTTTPLALYAGDPAERAAWMAATARAAQAAGLALHLAETPEGLAPERVDYLLVSPKADVGRLDRFPRLKAILSLWAGVERLLARDDLPAGVPIARMVEDGMTAGMTEFVLGHVLRIHLGLDACLADTRAGRWRPRTPPLAPDRRVGVLGLGALGQACAAAIAAVGFDVAGWSRTPKALPRVTSFAGANGLEPFLARTDILVVLAPLTADTRGLLDARRLALLPAGAHVLNVARGPILVDADLLAALDRPGGLGGATLDVFETEPLPAAHPFWRHPKVAITPHMAAATRPDSAAETLVRQILKVERGEMPDHLVDRARGY